MRPIRTKYLDVGIRFPEQIRLYPEHPIEMWSGLPTYQCKLDRPVNLFPFQPKKRPINKFNKGMFCLLNFQFFFIKCERNSSSTFLVLFGPGADPEILFRPCQELVQLPGVLLWDLFPKTELPPRVVQPSPENPHHRTKVPRKFENKHE